MLVAQSSRADAQKEVPGNDDRRSTGGWLGRGPGWSGRGARRPAGTFGRRSQLPGSRSHGLRTTNMGRRFRQAQSGREGLSGTHRVRFAFA